MIDAPAATATTQPIDDDERLRVRIAWAHFIQGMTQGEVARRFKLNRVRVNRLIAAMREDGTVQIFINSPATPFVALERELEQAFGLQRAVIAPSASETAGLRNVIAAAAGSFVSEQLKENIAVGIGWGRTLQLSLRSIRRRAVPGLSVTALIGGLTRTAMSNAYETAMHLAELCDGECFYIPAPVFLNDPGARELLLQQDMIKQVMARAAAIDLALVSVGGLGSSATMAQLGLVDADAIRSLKKAGAEGDFLGYFIDDRGTIVDHPLNRRVFAVAPETLRRVPQVVLASGGRDKENCLLGALRGQYANVLITDDTTGRRLLAKAGE